MQFVTKRAYQTTAGQWVTQSLSGTKGCVGSLGSKNPQDLTGQFDCTFVGGAGGAQWAILNSFNNYLRGGLLYLGFGSNSSARRWSIGALHYGFTYPLTVNGVDQAFYYDTITNTSTQLTFDDGDKSKVFMWSAPEYNGDLVLQTVINFNGRSGKPVSARIYRSVGSQDPSTGVFTLLTTILPTSDRPYINSPEPFTYKNKSYVFYLLSATPTGGQAISDLYFASIVPDATGSPSFTRQVSDLNVAAIRSDPEYFTYNPNNLLNPDGSYPLYLYYVGADTTQQGITGQIHRCETGL